ncbi:ParB/RepB/Spo0J family partition protein [Deinococcus roseus]|uniref:Chromosome partitioning protein ParB n=1 Tax=Deinococcus roseus TaxID=392414 RepID=A0ABQ2DBR2_9DEIO|nr:ParB/RepB/Spo0J family partition protein [Deinococcus roseus]GGJ52273.1 chromosome partitioning protein ParB [Deinococcus roseus]
MSKRPAGGAASLAKLLNVALAQEDTQSIQNLPLSEVHPDPQQLRRFFASESLGSLSESIRKLGVQNPIQVQPRQEGGYWIVTGERRFRASQLAGKDSIPAVVLPEQTPEQLSVLQMIENSQREDLDEYTQTQAMVGILGLRYQQKQEDLVRWLGSLGNDVSEEAALKKAEVETLLREIQPGLNFLSFVKNRLPLLKLPEDLKLALQEGKLEYTKARVLGKIKQDGQRQKLLQDTLEKGYSLEQLKTQVQKLQEKSQPQSSLVDLYLKGKEQRRYQRLNQEKKALVEAKLKELQELLNS